MNDNKRELSIHGSSQHSVNIAGDQNVVHFHTGTGELSAEPSFRLYNVPDEPPNFIPRPEILDSLKQRILRSEGNAVAITSARKIGVHGMGGIGKTVLAAVLARDESVQKHFSDGIYWIVLGQTPDIVSRQKQLAHAISRKPEDFIDVHVGKARIGELLSARSCLVVLDDVWEMNHAAAFNALGSGSQLLVTTRNANIITGLGADGYSLDLLTSEQARKLLSAWSGMSELPFQADEIIRECGFLPLAVSMVGAMLKDKPLKRWESVLKRFQDAELEKIRQEFPEYPYQNLFAALHVSVEALKPELRKRYSDFAIFPEDTPIPSAVVQRLWESYGAEPEDIGDDTDLLVSLSLLRRDDKERLTLHDLQMDYLRFQAKAQMPQLHHKLTEALKPVPESGEIRSYYYEHLCYHLHGADRHEELRQLLLDFRWLEAKLDACDVNLLIRDFRFLPDDRTLRLIKRTLELSSHVLAKDKSQLASQMHGRLLSQESSEILKLLGNAKCKTAWLRPLTCSLTPPDSSLIRTLEGHSSAVTSVAITPDGKLAVSGSWDTTLKVWETSSGRELRDMTGHSESVKAVAITPDGRFVVSGSKDKNLKIWEIETGKELRTLEGHSESVNAVAITPDGRFAVSGSEDNTLKVWEIASGMELRTLTGHSDSVKAVAITPDGNFAVSGSKDKTLKVWEIGSGIELRTLTGHSDSVNAVAITPEGNFAVSGSSDNMLKVWEIESGNDLGTMTEHSGMVYSVLITPDGKFVVSGSYDNTLKVWEINNNWEIRTLPRHPFSFVNMLNNLNLTITSDGKFAISGSMDNKLKVWEIESGRELRTFEGHSNFVTAIAITPDGKFAISGSMDNKLKVWEIESGRELRTLEGHSIYVTAIAITPDGKFAISGAVDRKLKVWEIETGRELRTLLGHSDCVQIIKITPDGKFAITGSQDKTIKIWEISTGMILRTLTGHSKDIGNGTLAITPDGKFAVSVSDDCTLKIWEIENDRELRTLTGHYESVAITPDGKFVVSASNKDDRLLKVWEIKSGKELRTLTGHSSGVTVTITPDGKFVVFGSDKTLKIWCLNTGNILITFPIDAYITACAVSPDGKTIVAVDLVGNVHFLRLENADAES